AVLFGINCVVVGLIYGVREGYRKFYSRKHKLETTHTFCPFGAVMTLVSTVLWNTFSLASYMKADTEVDGRYGRLLFHSAVLILRIGFAAFLLNFVMKWVVLQMVYVFAVMSLFINMVPIPPKDGLTVRKWDP
ncbi:MAG: hypothetical protein KKG04_06240, partial [Candidatus Thermoplasmatota archaeon]|nr:hypothetical protein [Candidatus Thermoplasmatota archaeon]